MGEGRHPSCTSGAPCLPLVFGCVGLPPFITPPIPLAHGGKGAPGAPSPSCFGRSLFTAERERERRRCLLSLFFGVSLLPEDYSSFFRGGGREIERAAINHETSGISRRVSIVIFLWGLSERKREREEREEFLSVSLLFLYSTGKYSRN